MGLEKFGMSLSAFIKANGKNSILQTKPIKITERQGFKYKPELNTDTFAKKLTLGWKNPLRVIPRRIV